MITAPSLLTGVSAISSEFSDSAAVRAAVMTSGSPFGSRSLLWIRPEAVFLLMELFSATSALSSLAMGRLLAPVTVKES